MIAVATQPEGHVSTVAYFKYTMRFDELYLSGDILDAIDAMHFEHCTPIQEQTIPLITDGRDVIAVAQTGTGKTAAYLLPVIDELANGDYPTDAINCIVMAPTRELAQQIDQQMQGFSYFMPVNSVAVYGGTDGHTFEQQRKGLKLGADVVIATPGRLLAHLSMGYVDLSRVSFLVLDEADRMLDMGFYDDIMQIVKKLPTQRQTLLFSATMPPKIKKLASEILHEPAEVKIAVSKPAEKIDQSAYVCYETQKLPVLRHIFKTLGCEKSIVFASSKLKCKELARTLRSLHLSVGEMHSDLDQSRREQMLLDFKSGNVMILVATDIVARGIDIDDIGVVVNYDVPHENEDYVHRIGRTARADNDGIAITLVSEKEIGKFKRIEKFIGKEVRKNELPEEAGEGPAYEETRTTRGSNDRRRKRKKKEQPTRTDAPSPKEEKKIASDSGDGAEKKPKKRRRNRNNRRKGTTADETAQTQQQVAATVDAPVSQAAIRAAMVAASSAPTADTRQASDAVGSPAEQQESHTPKPKQTRHRRRRRKPAENKE